MKKYTLSLLFLALCCCWSYSQSVCNRAISIRCGQSIEGQNITASNSFGYSNHRGCLPGSSTFSNSPFDAGDVVYRLTVDQGETVVRLTGLAADLDLFVFRSCSGEVLECIDGSTNSNNSNESIPIRTAGTYYLVIDGQRTSNRSGFTLSVDCEGGGNENPCEEAEPIDCDETIRSNNFSGGSNFSINNFSACHSSNSSFNGNDRVYRLDLPNNRDEVRVELSGLSADLDLFIFEGDCAVGSCEKKSTRPNNSTEILVLQNAANKTYYLVIDAPNNTQTSNFSLKVTCEDPCEDVETEIDDCESVSFQYAGSNGSLRYQFSVPSSLPSGRWTAKKGNSTIQIGSGRTINFTFNSGGEYEVCYVYTNADGCEIKCCKTIFIENPYDCDKITYSYNRNTQQYTLTIPGIPAGNVINWRDDQTGQIVGTGTSINVSINSTCEVRLFSVTFIDPATNCYRVCCLRIYICDPYDCDDITATENASNYTLRIPGIPAANIIRWQDDQTFATIATNTNSVSVPKPAAGQCAYYSVFFLDPATNCYRVCCVKICNEDCTPDLDCDLVDFNYTGQNGTLRYTFTVPTGTASGTWSISGGQYGNNGFNIGTGLTTSFTFPSVGTYTICYTYRDAEGCEKRCCKTICIAGDPYDCDLIQQVYNASSNTWTLSVPNTAGTRVAFWQNDITFARFGQGQTSVSVPNPPTGQCAYYSVKVYDPACGGYKLCCLEICPPTGCGSTDFIDVKCTDDSTKYDLLLAVNNTSGRSNVDVEFTILSPLGVTFQGCQSYIKLNNIGTGINPSLQLEGCLVPLTAGMTVRIKVSLVDGDPNSNWCCHLEDIVVTIPDCDDCIGTPDPDRTCNADYTPVCGCDGMTYSNACEAERAGIQSWTLGECPCTDCPDNPLAELSWLKDLADGLDQCCNGSDKEIKQCKLDGKCVFIVPDCALADGFTTIYDCEGNVICQDGGFAGNICDELNRLTDCKVIWTCSSSSCDAPCVGTDLVKNGDFEGGYFGFGSDLAQNCSCAVGSYCINTNAKAKCNNTLWSPVTSTGNFLIVDGATTFPYQIWNQNNINITTGNTYSFSFDFYPNVSGAISPVLELWVGNTMILSNITGTLDRWTKINTNWTSTFTGTVQLSIRQAQRGGNDDFGIDNIRFTECQTATGDPLKDIAWLQTYVGDGNYSISQAHWNGETIYVLQDFCFVSDGTTYFYDCKGNLICESYQIGGTCVSGFTPTNYVPLQNCNAPNGNRVENRETSVSQDIQLSNAPNPFRNSTTITFTLPTSSEASIEIFDTNGKIVFTQNGNYSEGEHRIELNTAQQLSAGIYYYRLSTSTQVLTKSMMVLD